VLLSDRVVMMTNGPSARIGEILEVTVPKPRDRLALAHDARFMALRARVLEFLYEKQARAKAALKVA
jgi:nitrate/nitrite transport system ATP-binding protein